MLLCVGIFFFLFLLLTDLDAAKPLHVMQLFIIAAEKYDSYVTDAAFRKRLPPFANTSTTTGMMTRDFWVETVALLRSAEGG